MVGITGETELISRSRQPRWAKSLVDRRSPAFGTETGFAASIWAKLNEAGLMFSDKETRFLEAGLFMAVPLSILIAVLVVSVTFGWFG